MKKFNEELIEKFRNGEISIYFSKNNDSLVDLKNVLRKAFPLCAIPLGNHSCYYRHQLNIETWSCNNLTRAHHSHLSDFFIEEPEQWQPKEGEVVEVRDSDAHNWKTRIFIAISQTGKYFCVNQNDEINYRDGGSFQSIPWKQMRQFHETKPELDLNGIISEKLGRPLTPADLKIIEVATAYLNAEKEQQQQ